MMTGFAKSGSWVGLALGALVAGCTAGSTAPAAAPVETRAEATTMLHAELEAAFAGWERQGPTGDVDHRERLARLASAVEQRLATSGEVDLVFVCTHNSRRSHMAQLLGRAAAIRKGLAKVRTFSGGTEVTAFNARAVAALQRVGMRIEGGAEPNPHHLVRLGPSLDPVEAFSKRFGDPPNPTRDFVVVMTCSQADAACPLVPGAAARVAVPYEDPKVADGTPEETARYDERVAQIGRDLAWVFAQVAAHGPPRR